MMFYKIILLFIISHTHLFGIVNIEAIRYDLHKNSFFHDLTLDSKVLVGNTDYNAYDITYHGNLIRNSKTFFFQISFSEYVNQNTIIKKKGLSHLRYIKKNNNKSSYEFFIQKEFDKFAKIVDRKLIGQSLRFNVLKTRNSISFFGVGPMIETIQYLDKSSVDNIRLSTYLTGAHTIKKNCSLTSTIYFQPKLLAFSNFNSYFSINLHFKIFKQLKFISSGIINHTSHPYYNLNRTNIEVNQKITISF